MQQKRLELESILLTALAAFPLYWSDPVSSVSVGLFHSAMALIAAWKIGNIRWLERPGVLLKIVAVGYLIFFPIDALVISQRLITASLHLLFFLAAYQAVDAESAGRSEGQRLLVAFLLFITSVATSTALPIVFFIIIFAFLAFRHLIRLSHRTTVEQIGMVDRDLSTSRMAFGFLAVSAVAGMLFFPLLPRVRNPLMPGLSNPAGSASTGISDSIDFSVAREISSDSSVVARVWMSQDTIPFFTPLRLRGRVYDEVRGNKWRASRSRGVVRQIDRSSFQIARPVGFRREVTIQQQLRHGGGGALFLPVGTFEVSGVPDLTQHRKGDYRVPPYTPNPVDYQASMSRDVVEFGPPPSFPDYPVTPEEAVMAKRIVGDARTAREIGARIEAYMSRNFTYVPDPASIGRPISVEDFLLRERRGHCEYFAAGMTVLVSSLGVPARIAGGYYGGELNPLTGYFIVREKDAHAWVEIYDGQKWLTFDPTPPSLRPGNASRGLVQAYASALGESVNYFWDRYILTFGLADQVELFRRFLWRGHEAMNHLRGALRSWPRSLPRTRIAIILSMVILAAISWQIARRLRRSLFDRLSARLVRFGIEVTPSMTSGEILERVRSRRPDLTERILPIVRAYEREAFSERSLSRAERQDILRRLAEIG
ncbi:MAG: transglutaminaseTgpA domain-containing protein [Thermoanaerobaculia bacterium]